MLTDEIISILKQGNQTGHYYYHSLKLAVARRDNCFILDFSDMYNAPPLSFAKLKAISELFGTDEIDVDDYANSGCETCDFGSEYGHTIQIYNPTKNVTELTELVGKTLIGE